MLDSRLENEDRESSQFNVQMTQLPSTSKNVSALYSSIFSSTDVTSEDNELDRYFNAEFFEVGDNMNEFWRINQSRFPTISKVARKLLTIPPSTAECERSFSRLHIIRIRI